MWASDDSNILLNGACPGMTARAKYQQIGELATAESASDKDPTYIADCKCLEQKVTLKIIFPIFSFFR